MGMSPGEPDVAVSGGQVVEEDVLDDHALPMLNPIAAFRCILSRSFSSDVRYTRFAVQGGDWGNAVTEQMALQLLPELIGIHTNMPATLPDDISKAPQFGTPPPSGLSADEKRRSRYNPDILAVSLCGGPHETQMDGADRGCPSRGVRTWLSSHTRQ
jgi:hypothetical protein